MRELIASPKSKSRVLAKMSDLADKEAVSGDANYELMWHNSFFTNQKSLNRCICVSGNAVD